MSAPVVVIGAGAFGTALACVAARSGQKVTLFGRDSGRMQTVQATRRNEPALPGVALPDNLTITADMTDLTGAQIVLFAVPAQSLRDAAARLKTVFSSEAALIICAKGIEQTSGLFLSDVLESQLPDNPVAALSGPGFAGEIARELPTALTLACSNIQLADRLAAKLSNNRFRLYASDDVKGVETGGALKNVLAIACGIVEGRGLGESARAALIARGLAELMRFAAAHGGKADTMAGLSGLGDLVLTATSHQSRNLRFGLALGKGRKHEELTVPDAPLSEGAYTAGVAARISLEKNIDMPITRSIAAVLQGSVGVEEAIDALMSRPLKSENSNHR